MTQEDTELLKRFEKVLNDKGRIVVRVKSFWVPVIFTLIGTFIGVVGSWTVWAYTGKVRLDTNDRITAWVTNGINSISDDMVSAAQLRIYSDWLERYNTNFTAPDVDQIKSFYPYVLPVMTP